jgi:hypothetical protein
MTAVLCTSQKRSNPSIQAYSNFEKHRQTGSGVAMMRQVVMAALCVLALSSAGCLVPTAQGYMDCIVTLTLNVPTTVCTPVP